MLIVLWFLTGGVLVSLNAAFHNFPQITGNIANSLKSNGTIKTAISFGLGFILASFYYPVKFIFNR